MKLILFGATGKTGQHLLRQALNKGHQVTAFVRTPGKLNIQHADLSIIPGDLTSREGVLNAIKGHNAVLSTLGHSSPFKYDPAVVAGMRNIVEAMQQENVRRLIYLSVAGVHEDREGVGFLIKYVAPILLRTEIQGHTEREDIIRQSQLDWTIVHATTLTNGALTQNYQSGENIRSGTVMVKISRADVADFMLRELNENRYIHKAPRIMY